MSIRMGVFEDPIRIEAVNEASGPEAEPCPSSDEEILRRILKGQKEAYGQLFLKYREIAYGLALQYTRNKEDALDVVQDVFIKAYRKLRTFDTRRPFSPWLLRIVRNQCVDFLRKRKRTQTVELPIALGDPGAQRRTEERLLKNEVWRCLSKLEPQHREIIFLKDYQGHSYAEIAIILEIPLGTVMSRLHHARRKLAEILLGGNHAV